MNGAGRKAAGAAAMRLAAGAALLLAGLAGCLVEPDEAEPTPATPATRTPAQRTCAQRLADEPSITWGEDDQVDGKAQWAVLREGSRLWIGWATRGAPFVASLGLELDGVLLAPRTEDSASTYHVFELGGLPVGGVLCFTLQQGIRDVATHAVRLVNGPSHRDGDAYRVNLMAVDAHGDTARASKAIQDLAVQLNDATDGHVKLGTVLLLDNTTAHGNAGWRACYVENGLGCSYGFDMVFTHDIPGAPPRDVPAPPQNGSLPTMATVLDGFRDVRAAVWADLDMVDQRDPEFADGSVGNLLMRQMGHYLFGMARVDAFRPCLDRDTGVSVMGGDVDFVETEFDDTVNRCPNEDLLEGYVPSWTRLRERFPHVPERTGAPDPGPTGNGGLFQLVTLPPRL